jgi:hypothetical protein
VDDDGGGVLADLGGVGGAVAACETEHRAQSTEHSKRIREAAEHVSIIRFSHRGCPAADSFRHYSRAQ